MPDYRALADFRYQIRQFLGKSESVARSFGLEPQQHQLLLSIKGLPIDDLPTIGRLAERLLLQHHTTVELVDRLEKMRLVQRERDEDDRRRVLVRLTPAGDDVLQSLSLTHEAELQSLAPALMSALQAVIDSAASRRSSDTRARQPR